MYKVRLYDYDTGEIAVTMNTSTPQEAKAMAFEYGKEFHVKIFDDEDTVLYTLEGV